MAQTKRMELALAERYRREAQLAHFIRTSRSPPLHWLPAKHCDETLQLLDKEQERLAAWKVRTVCCLGTGKQEFAWGPAVGLVHERGSRRVLTFGKCYWTVAAGRHEVAMVQADEVAKLEAEKERILQRLPSSAKPAANGTEGNGQAEGGTEGEHSLAIECSVESAFV